MNARDFRPPTPLDAGQRHLMRLAARDADAEGWTKVSKVVWPMVAKLPADLVDLRPSDDGGHVRLTEHGHVVLQYT